MARWGLYGVRVDGHDKLTLQKHVSSPAIMGCGLIHEISRMLSDWGMQDLVSKGRALHLVDREGRCRHWIAYRDLRSFLEDGAMVDDTWAVGSYIACDWAYIVNLDGFRFEVYRAFQREPHSRGRYARLEPDVNGTYYPIALVGDWPLDALPKRDDFLRELIAVEPQAAVQE